MSRPRALSHEQEIDIACRYATEGLSALALAFDITEQTVCNILRRLGVPLKHEQVQRPPQPTRVEARVVSATRTPRAIIEPTLQQDGLVPCSARLVEELCRQHHVYQTSGPCSTYCFAVVEHGRLVAAFAWQPPTLGAARSVCPEEPAGVLGLSRMVAVPKNERRLRHLSKPLRQQMRDLIDRTRWPVLVTYSDEGQGHTGHVYKCSGWQKTLRAERPFYLDGAGRRRSIPTSKRQACGHLHQGGRTVLQRWEHWACPRGEAATWMAAHGWRREEVPGRVWRSGNPAFTWIRR